MRAWRTYTPVTSDYDSRVILILCIDTNIGNRKASHHFLTYITSLEYAFLGGWRKWLAKDTK